MPSSVPDYPSVVMRRVGDRAYDFESRRAQRLYRLRPRGDGQTWTLEEHDTAEGGGGHVETITCITLESAIDAVFNLAHDTVYHPEQ